MRSVSWKWWICCLLLLATMLNYMDRLTLNLTIVRIMHDFGLSVTEYARLESAFSLAFGAGALFFGWLADRWNVRLLYPLVVLAWSAAGFVTGLSWSFGSLLVCRFLLGLTEAGHWPCAIRTTQRILPAGERTMGNSLLQSGAALGSVLTPMVVLALVMEPAPWERPEWVAGAIGSTATSTAFGVAAGAGLAAWLVPVYQPGAWRYPFWVIGGLGIFWVAGWLISMRRTDWTGPAGWGGAPPPPPR
ncbi:MAG: MFS transporter, partial [Gemmataceae bacterium]|nr:MFS transporter [Gemmataceae bacterium]MDW8267349.1 MFS transporter [Gemmataceae bacterium]